MMDGKSGIVLGMVRICLRKKFTLISSYWRLLLQKIRLDTDWVSASDREQLSLIIPAAGVLRSYSNAVISGHRVAGRERGQYLPWGWVVMWVLPEMSLSVACATFACRSRDRGATPRPAPRASTHPCPRPAAAPFIKLSTVPGLLVMYLWGCVNFTT